MKLLIDLRLEPEMIAALDKIAAHEGNGRSSVIRRLLKAGLENEGKPEAPDGNR